MTDRYTLNAFIKEGYCAFSSFNPSFQWCCSSFAWFTKKKPYVSFTAVKENPYFSLSLKRLDNGFHTEMRRMDSARECVWLLHFLSLHTASVRSQTFFSFKKYHSTGDKVTKMASFVSIEPCESCRHVKHIPSFRLPAAQTPFSLISQALGGAMGKPWYLRPLKCATKS